MSKDVMNITVVLSVQSFKRATRINRDMNAKTLQPVYDLGDGTRLVEWFPAKNCYAIMAVPV